MTTGETVDEDIHLVLGTIQEGRIELKGDGASTDLNRAIGMVVE